MSGFGGRGGGRGGRGRGRGGRGGGYHQRQDNMSGGPDGPPPKFKPCRNFTQTGACPQGHNCSFHHVVQLHASIDASTQIQQQQQQHKNNYNNNRGGYNQNQNRMAAISSVSVWQTNENMIKIFTGSHDGFWRLWDTANGKFVKEFEHNMSGKVETLEVASNFLFCGFEGTCLALPNVEVGMIHAWNLSAPNNPPLEFHMHNLAPYAHASAVSIVKVVAGDKILSGDRRGVIRVWQFETDKFVLMKTLHGHVGEIAGLTAVDTMIWSAAATDQTIRLWDLNKDGECQHVIPAGTPTNTNAPQQQGGAAAPNGVGAASNGHTGAITSLLPFKSSAGSFVLSSSLDGTVKAWNSSDGSCVHTETHGAGVVTMALSADQKNHPILLVGLETGNIMVRNVMQTPNAPAFCLLFSLSSKYTAGHSGACRTVKEGPAATFYSGGDDGKLLVWQLTGDLGL
eukprot:CAMPEP_0195306570 /NCGR_PEP_ID=MMETSP0707-20130614/37266_1 /TAXON_ID=33640 /ORGANISM="Asterionellopsis glacialis, Strain CCMP134" /LENGTH=453 /DNA_ID=CAMNT_0040370789 /DNA_START=115 /DNA_END=1476 /DNA_ORIENTATION=-